MDSFLTIAETADLYGVSEKTVRRWIADSQIVAWRMPGGRLLRIDASSLDGILEPVNYRGYTSRSQRKVTNKGKKEFPPIQPFLSLEATIASKTVMGVN